MKLYTGLLIATLMGAPQMGLATQIIRQGTADVSVYKTTLTKVNGRYQKTVTVVCEQTVTFPVTDERVPTGPLVPAPADMKSSCTSTVKNKPVIVETTPIVWIFQSEMPWTKGQKKDFKGFGVISFAYAKNNDVDLKSLQATLRSSTITEDLSLKQLGFILDPDVAIGQKACSDPTPSCEPTDFAELEEYFSVVVNIEDKNI